MPATARWCWTKSSCRLSCVTPSPTRTDARTRVSEIMWGGIMKKLLLAGLLLALAVPAQARDRWTQADANSWYARQKWPVGANYIPADAINQLEMWQEA